MAPSERFAQQDDAAARLHVEYREIARSQDQLNPLGLNPMRRVLDDLLDPSVFGAEGAPMLVVSTTRVRTGQARLFRDAEITAQVLLASSCLPQLFPAIEIEGEPYWDGGYASNPPLRALIVSAAPADLLVIRTMPVERPDLPTSAGGLLERTNELAFGAALRHELGSLAFAQRLLADLPETALGALGRLRAARLQMIGAEKGFRALKEGSHLDLTAAFLEEMRDLGHAAADEWIAENLGVRRCSFDLGPVPVRRYPYRPGQTLVFRQTRSSLVVGASPDLEPIKRALVTSILANAATGVPC